MVVTSTSLLNLYNYYNNMKFYGNYSIFEIDDMYPFEREIYTAMLMQYLEEEKQRIANRDFHGA
jgi:hypothetical protein